MNTSEFKLNLAVVIGINDYKNGISTLGTARQDAEAIAKTLETEYQYQVHLITDKTDIQATSKNLKDWLETDLPEAIKVANPSRLLFYFAGHGIALNGDDGPQGYLIPQDAKLGDVSTYIPMQQVEEALTKLSCRHCLVILDCCFAGAFRWSSTRKLVPITETIHKERYDRFIQDPAWQVITSAASDQYALDNLDLKGDRGIAKSNKNHSPFAAALIEALSGSADAYPPASNGKPAGDGIITATELYLYLRDSVEIPSDANNQRQTPQIWCLKKHDKGEFIFLPPGHERNLPPAPSLDALEDNNPYRGLKSYETKDSALFFGRTALIDKLCDAMSDRPFTVVLGASGSGKSSLVKAGLIAHLDGSAHTQQAQNQRLKPQEHPHQCKYRAWKILAPVRPGESPLNSLKSVLKELGVAETEKIDSQIFTETITAWSQDHPETKLLLVIDQFEELITLCRNEQERQQFLDLLADLLKAHPEVLRLVVTLRSDFEPQFRNTALEKDWLAARFVVPAMTREELRAVIEEPASTKVVYFESLDNRGYLVDQLIDEVAGMPGALPLLSFALSELYLKLARRYVEAQNTGDTVERSITWSDYDEIGGVTKSLTRRADEEYNDLVKADPAYEKTIRHVMLRMVAVGGELARRQVPESELKYPKPESTRVREVIGRFSAARLLVSGTDVDDKPYIEPAHDALVRGWEKLLSWKKEEENLILQRRLTPAAVEWDNVKRKEQKGFLDNAVPVLNWLDRVLFTVENLLNKIPAQFARLLQRSRNQQGRSREKSALFLWDSNPYLGLLDQELHSDDNWLNQVEGEFVQESVLQKRRNISWRWRIAIGVILGLSGLTIAALIQLQEAQRQRMEQLATNVEALIDSQPVNAVMSAIAATGLSQSALVQFPDHPQFGSVDGSLLDVVRVVNLENNQLLHDGRVLSVAFSPDGQRIVSGSEDKKVRVWDAATGKLIKTLPGHEDLALSVSYSPNGKFIVSGSEDKKVRVWDAATGKLIMTLLGHKGPVLSVAFSPDSQRIVSGSGSNDGTVRVWDAATGKLIMILPGHERPVWSERVMPDGKPFVTDEVTSVSYSPEDGKRIVSGSNDGTVRVWNADTGKLIRTLQGREGPEGQVWSVSYSPDGKFIVSGSNDGKVWVWDAATGKLIRTLPGHTQRVTSVSYSPDGQRIVSGSSDNMVRIWDAKTGAPIGQPLQGHTAQVTSVAYGRDGQSIISGSSDKTVRVWDASTGAPIGQPLLGDGGLSVSYSPDGQRIVSVSIDGTVRLWDASTGEPIGKPLQDDKNRGFPVLSVAYSRDGQRIVSGSYDGTVRVWDAATGKLIRTSPGQEGQVWSVSYSPDGKRIVSGSNDGTVRVWDASTGAPIGKPLQDVKNRGFPVLSVSYSPDGKRIVSGSLDNMVRQWDAKTGAPIGQPLPGDGGLSVSYSPDGKHIVSGGSNKTVQVWDASTGEPIGKPLQGHEDAVISVAYSRDGQRIVSGSKDKKVRVWDAKTGAPIGKPLQGHEGSVTSVSFSPDGQRIVSGSGTGLFGDGDHTVRVWDISWKHLLPIACNQLRYHPSLKQPTTDVAREAKQTCEQYVWKP